ncbi:hypothetical protein F9278_36535 [Streptomyces phaeolivaceus]|uniref:WXG100 family type VII secretion target n=1 Tax=Streptomyces phaeolivaceus TaxID=2653200 RepID=A0A5P8KCP7_9ACTN|nr:hypothetical protein [Streptomyces phaeolivaceus]QFR00785.1 hypothetical protein F9278_36535 [Streptomyces phaeolivaceus]
MAKNVIDDEEVESTARKLDSAVSDTLVPRLSSIQAEVDNLLQGGLLLAATSPKMQTSYANFNKSLTEAVTNITQFSKQFRDICNAVNNLDKQIASGIPD